jgi:uncharacterized RDD family membrane protein YckC
VNIKTEPKILKRSISFLIDYGLYLIFFVWLVTTFGEPNDEGGYSLNNDPKGWWIFIVWLIYFPIIESINGQTLGKLILGLKVISKSGSRITFWQSFKRHVIDMLDFMFFGLVAFIAIRNTPNNQRLGDLFANTIVIGGDTYYCTNCHTQLSLNYKEILRREYKCPSCNESIKL